MCTGSYVTSVCISPPALSNLRRVWGLSTEDRRRGPRKAGRGAQAALRGAQVTHTRRGGGPQDGDRQRPTFLQKHPLFHPKGQVSLAGAQGKRAASPKPHQQLHKSRLKENTPTAQACNYRACSEKIHCRWRPGGAPPGQSRDQRQSKGPVTSDKKRVTCRSTNKN